MRIVDHIFDQFLWPGVNKMCVAKSVDKGVTTSNPDNNKVCFCLFYHLHRFKIYILDSIKPELLRNPLLCRWGLCQQGAGPLENSLTLWVISCRSETMVSVFYCLFFVFSVPAEGASCVFRFAPLKHNVCVILGENVASGEAGCENGTWYDLHFREWWRNNGNPGR